MCDSLIALAIYKVHIESEKRLPLCYSVALRNVSLEALAFKLNSVYSNVDKKLLAVVKCKTDSVECVKQRFYLAVTRCNDLALSRFYCCTKTKYALRKGLVRNVFKLYSLAAKRSCDNAVICYVCIFSLCFDSLLHLLQLRQGGG